jgi:hypothetical protein
VGQTADPKVHATIITVANLGNARPAEPMVTFSDKALDSPQEP